MDVSVVESHRPPLWPEVTLPHDLHLRWLLLPAGDVWKGRAEILLLSLTPTT